MRMCRNIYPGVNELYIALLKWMCIIIIVNTAVSKKRVSPGSLKTVSIMATVLLGGPLATLFMSAVAKKMFKTLGMHISLSWEEYRRHNSLAFANREGCLSTSLQALTSGYAFNHSMEKVALPANLQTLTVGYAFNQSMEKVACQRVSRH